MGRPLKHTASKGDTFGRLTVLKPLRKRGSSGHRRALVICVCGNVKAVVIQKLHNGDTTSCGCARLERTAAMGLATRKHGAASSGGKRHPLYDTWSGMVRRCHDPRRKDYPRYGGRGIEVCPEWREDPRAFIAYAEKLEHYGEPGYTLDRVNNDLGYKPGNVRFATWEEQNHNRRGILTPETADEIKRLYASTARMRRYDPDRWTQEKLAVKFGVSRSIVIAVLNNQHWTARSAMAA